MASERQRLNILLIGNNIATTRLVTDSLKSSNTRCRLLSVEHGPKSVACLKREGAHRDEPAPDLVLFDAACPDNESLQALKTIKTDPACRNLPIVLLTRDDAIAGLEEFAAENGGHTAFSPVDLDSFLDALNAINPERFIGSINLLANVGFVLVRIPDESANDAAGEPDQDQVESRRSISGAG